MRRLSAERSWLAEKGKGGTHPLDRRRTFLASLEELLKVNNNNLQGESESWLTVYLCLTELLVRLGKCSYVGANGCELNEAQVRSLEPRETYFDEVRP
jgi:hypothetical protein